MKYYSTHTTKDSALCFIKQIREFVIFEVLDYEIRFIENTPGSESEYELWIKFNESA